MITFPKTISAMELRKILEENRQTSDFSSTDRNKMERALEAGEDFVVCAEFLPAQIDGRYSYLRLERKSSRTVGLERVYGATHALVVAEKAA